MKARKTSTPAALATGGGGEDLHIQVGGGMENEICNFKEELKMQMEKEFCHRRGWQHRALQLRGQLLQRGGVGGAGQHCGDFQGSRCWVDSWVPGCEHRRPSTPGFRGVPVLPASSSTSSTRWRTPQSTTASQDTVTHNSRL